jgi:HEAT repeat protein
MILSETGLIFGGIAQALGKLRSRRAIPALRRLGHHESEWVRQIIDIAIRQLGDKG